MEIKIYLRNIRVFAAHVIQNALQESLLTTMQNNVCVLGSDI